SAYSPSQVPDLTALARTFAVSDRTFESDLTASWGSHLELVAGTIDGFLGNNPAYHRGPNVPAAGHGWGCDSQKQAQWVPPGGGPPELVPSCVPFPDGTGAFERTPVPWTPTIMDRLDAAGLPWRIYSGDGPVASGPAASGPAASGRGGDGF